MTSHDAKTETSRRSVDLFNAIPSPRREVVPAAPNEDEFSRWTSTAGEVDAPSTYEVLGASIAAITPAEATAKILDYAREGRSRQVHLCNSYTLTLARRDERLTAALADADLNLPDGTPVAWLGRKAGTTGPVRGPGLTVDVFLAGVARDDQRGLRHYLYGGADGVAEAMADALLSRDDRIEIVGAESPPFRPLSDSELKDVAARINASGTDVVWIGLGTPRQDHLVADLAPLVTATLVPVGAAFDFISGRVPEAPELLHGTGFEWLYRLTREPRRLWRRYVLDGARFGVLLITYRGR